MATIKSEMKDIEAMAVSASAYLTVYLTDFRNGSEDMGIAETMARRVVGELGYTALALTSLVETVFRAALCVLLPIACLCCNEEINELLATVALVGALISAENALNATAALVQNIYTQEIDYDKIIPCIESFNNDTLGS
jgi:hypothetical protein